MRPLNLIGVILCVPFAACAQIEMSRYLDEEYRPYVNIYEYRDVFIRWEMDGKVQAFLNEGLNSQKQLKQASQKGNQDAKTYLQKIKK